MAGDAPCSFEMVSYEEHTTHMYAYTHNTFLHSGATFSTPAFSASPMSYGLLLKVCFFFYLAAAADDDDDDGDGEILWLCYGVAVV